MPRPVVFDGQRLPASYANFYIANGLVLVPTFNDPADRVALDTLASAFPDREVVGIHCVDLVLGLGTLHCLSQQQPAGPTLPNEVPVTGIHHRQDRYDDRDTIYLDNESSRLEIFGRPMARPRPGWNGIGSMSRRRSFPREGTPIRTRRRLHADPRPGSKPRPRPDGAAGRAAIRLARHDARPWRKPRLFKDGGGAEPGKHDRLQKVLAHAGLGSRRGCEQLILQGRVSDQRRDHPPARHAGRPRAARITVDGEPIKLESMVYYAVNKPKGYVSTNSDPSGRPRVVDLLPEIPERVYTVGRLDEASTGLLILTNDGDLANRLAHPRYGVEKLYRALVAGLPTPEMLAKLTEGVWLSDGKVRAKRARIVGRQGQATMLELVLAEGKKREIRRMLSKLGHKVMSLNRIAVGPDQPQGTLRRRMPLALAARSRAAPQSGLGRLGAAPSVLRWRLIEPASR